MVLQIHVFPGFGKVVSFCLDGLIFIFQLRLPPPQRPCGLENAWGFRRSDLIILSMTQTAFVLDHEEYVVVTQGSNNDGVSGLMDDG